MNRAKETPPKYPLVGRIVESLPHPNADRIRIARVDVGQPRLVEIVVGGTPLPVAGILVPVALPGVRLPSGEKLRSRSYRGVRSNGEILSSTELGWTANGPDRVLVLPESFFVGQDLYQADFYEASFVQRILEADADGAEVRDELDPREEVFSERFPASQPKAD